MPLSQGDRRRFGPERTAQTPIAPPTPPPVLPSDHAADATALTPTLVGQSLDQLCVGPGDAQLRFSDSNVSLWSPIRVSTASDALVQSYTLDAVALLLPLLTNDVAAVAISPSGELSLTLGGTTLWCRSAPQYEAWSYKGPRGEKVVCTPGGDLAIWK